MTRDEARTLDAADPLRCLRARFALPKDLIYLDGNSLGPRPVASAAAIDGLVQHQWGERLIRSWNEGWIEAPQRIGDKIGRLIGAMPGEVVAADSTSVNLFKLMVAALKRDPTRNVIVSEAGNFPTDLYIADGVIGCVPDAELRVVPRAHLAEALDEKTALLLLTHVHYKTAERFDMAAWSAKARAVGALCLWDLSHSVGAVPINLEGTGADLAVGCGYKYLNGGPGAPAFLYVRTQWQDKLLNPLSGWMGHRAPFAFGDGYEPAPGIHRWLTGTPSMLAMAALEVGVDLMLEADTDKIADKSVALFNLAVETGDSLGLECISPRNPDQRGSHISFRHPDAYALCQALISRGVIGDFRDPDILRFGLTPLYLGYEDLIRAGEILGDLLATGDYLARAFAVRRAVT